ncbi:MAG: 50S ribosomal protein L20 [bacterium]
MTRVKRGNVARKRRKKILKRCSGFRAALSKLYRPAHQAYIHAMSYKYRDRRNKKRAFRKLWISRLNASLETYKMKYNHFIYQLSTKKVILNRKTLSELAITEPKSFQEIINFIKK